MRPDVIPTTEPDDRLTVAAIAALAFILADVGHEVVGHALGFVRAGGHSAVLTTTRLNETQRLGDHGGDIFDLGGPFGNLLFAALPWLALHLLRPDRYLRFFLSLTTALSLFWAFAYLMFCGVFGHGDWWALIRAVPHQSIWRIAFVAGGFLLYRLSMRVLAADLSWVHTRRRAWRLLLTSYLAGGVIACVGAVLDPRGFYALAHDAALSGFGSAIGLLEIPRRLSPPCDGQGVRTIERSKGWIIASIAVSVFYIFVLGPGIKITF
jgi:hypothetical protein